MVWSLYRHLPHLNQLVTTADPHKVVFLAIDDEDPKVVEAFLTKRRVSGWVGLDPTSSVFHRFGIESRPATVVVDTDGRVAALTTPEELKGQSSWRWQREEEGPWLRLSNPPPRKCQQA